MIRRHFYLSLALVLLATLTVTARKVHAADVDFARDVAPIFESHCLQCHSDNIRKGDFSLSSIDDLKEYQWLGEGDPEASHLISMISGETPEMPREGPKLTAMEQQILRRWVESGASWPPEMFLREQSEADRSWWSLQPLAPRDPSATIDGLIERRLREHQLTYSRPADRRTLIRRASYDLTGLPPTPEQVEAFVADRSPLAYEQLIDRLLASPHYGQRWGRHWLDVVRFGESNGFERNVLTPGLWPFRDYVIRSLNEDKPFDQFVREHLAGDVIDPGNRDVVIGSAFLVAGPYDNVGNQDPQQQLQIRANTIDEMIRTTSEAFLGLTIGCARCHDHKFDPIEQKDYYRMYAAFAAVRHGMREVATAQEQEARAEKLAPLQQQRASLVKRREEIKAEIHQRALARLAHYEQQWKRPAVDRTGTEETFEAHSARFVRLICEGLDTNPAARRGFRIDEFEVWESGPSPRNVALASEGATASGPSRNIEDFPGAYGPQLTIDGKTGARFISTDDHLTIDLSQPQRIDRVVFSSGKDELKPDQPKFVFVSEYRIETSLDGESWRGVADGSDRKPVNETHRNHRLDKLEREPQETQQLAELDRQIKSLDRKINAVAPLPQLWVGHHAEAEARGPFHVFVGGSPARQGAEVKPASLSMLAEVTPTYRLEDGTPSGQRRLALARWITDPSNPLTPRVIVNRLWHYHFGRGLVATPSDFGYMGARPTHPALLDHLAQQLIQDGWRLKPLHKRIMMSRAYRQASLYREEAARVDGESQWLWRFPPRRLSAEEIRDTMLMVAGKLDQRMGGPGFQLYRYLQDNVATYVPRDQHPPETYRRAVYHQNARAAPVDLLTDYDQPDCAFSTARRSQTTTPLQALTSLNHSFTIDMAAAMAERLRGESPGDEDGQIARAFELCFARAVTRTEAEQCRALVEEHGLEALCRVLFNTSELVYVR